jgi:hypothetical protein
MEGSVLSVLKAEWEVSDTGSAQWASSIKVGGRGCQILHFSVINYVVTITNVLCNVNRSGSDYILFFIETQ